MRTVAALCLAIPLLASAQDAAPPPALRESSAPEPADAAPPTAPAARARSPWYIGVGLGYGNGSVDLGGRSVAFDEFFRDDPLHVAFAFKLGKTLTPRLLVGIETGFVSASTSGFLGSSSRSLQTNHYDLGVTFFPRERGLFVRGASGYSVANIGDAKGFNVLGGVGYAFWVGRSLNLTLNIEGVKHWYVGGDEADGSMEYAVYAGCDWY